MKFARYVFLFYLLLNLDVFCYAQNNDSKSGTIVIVDTIAKSDGPDRLPSNRNSYTAPAFPGGTRALNSFFKNNIVYPLSAINDKVSGKVLVEFLVKKNGKIKHLRIAKGIREDLDKETLRVIKLMPNWKPATVESKPFSQKIVLPVKFILP